MTKAYYDICPCKGCDKRVVGCHAKCIAYKEWKNNSVEIKANVVDFDKIKRRKKK